MTFYAKLDRASLEKEYQTLLNAYNEYKTKGLSLDMSRGKPGSDQLDLSQGMLSLLESADSCYSEKGADYRNYGILDGITEAKKLFADILDLPAENIIVCGNSSLNLMYDAVVRCML